MAKGIVRKQLESKFRQKMDQTTMETRLQNAIDLVGRNHAVPVPAEAKRPTVPRIPQPLINTTSPMKTGIQTASNHTTPVSKRPEQGTIQKPQRKPGPVPKDTIVTPESTLNIFRTCMPPIPIRNQEDGARCETTTKAIQNIPSKSKTSKNHKKKDQRKK
jgi:hypothetical protein